MLDHPIFHDFKHITIDVDQALIFPHGSSGHFLAKYLSLSNFQGKHNEYHIVDNKLDYPWFRLDTWGIEYLNNVYHLNDMYSVVKNIIIPNLKPKNKLLLGHFYPYVTAHVFNLQINQLIEINVKREHCVIPMSLANIKNLFLNNYQHKHFLLGHILSHYDSISKEANSVFNKNKFYSAMCADTVLVANEITKNIRGKLVEESSPYMWDYAIWARSNRLDISIESFKQFAYTVFGHDAAMQYYNEYYNIDTLMHKEYFAKTTSLFQVDYKDAFFEYPDIFQLNTDELKTYNENNISLLERLESITDSNLFQYLQERMNNLCLKK